MRNVDLTAPPSLEQFLSEHYIEQLQTRQLYMTLSLRTPAGSPQSLEPAPKEGPDTS